MTPVVEPEPVPLTRDLAGRLMVTGTRVPLDSLVTTFKRGESPEAIQESFPTVSLGDIYAVLTYCVRHPDQVSTYLTERGEHRAAIRARVEANSDPRQA
jgi:uncharacterized protein (DUF433 family)